MLLFVQIAPAIPACLAALAGEQGILMRVCQNPRQPGFNHYMFESVAALVRQGCASNASMVTQLEEVLFPPFQYVLQKDVQVGARDVDCSDSYSCISRRDMVPSLPAHAAAGCAGALLTSCGYEKATPAHVGVPSDPL